MKKILTLILVATLSIAAFAQTALTSKSQAMKSLIQKERLSNTLQSWQHPAHAQTKLAATPAEWTATTYTAAKAPAQLTGLDTTEVYFKSFHDDPIYYPIEIGRSGDTVGGDWYITLKNDRYQFIFDIYGASSETPAGTYTEKDLDEWFSWCMFPEADGKTHYYKTCELTITEENVGGALVTYTLDAVILATKGIGGEEYGYFKVHAEHTITKVTNKMDVAILNCTVEPEEDRIRIYGQNDTMDVDLTFFTELGVEGYYSHKLMDTENYKLIHRGTSYEIINLEGMIVGAEIAPEYGGGLAYVFMFEALTPEGILFNVAMEAPVVPVDTIDITCTNAVINDQWGISDQTIIINASNSNYEILAAYNDTKVTTPATYPNGFSGVELTNLRTEKTITSKICNLTIEGNKTDGYKVEISMIGSDHVQYYIHMSYGIPEVKETVVLDFKNNSKTWLYIDPMGSKEVQFANYNDEYSVSFDFPFIDQVMDTEFGRTELYEEQTFIIHHTIEDGSPVDIAVTFAEIGGKLWQENDTTFLTATVLGFDSIQYEISMFYTIPVPTQTVTYTFDGLGNDVVDFLNAVTSSGIFTLDAMSADGSLMAKVNVERIKTGTVEGTFYNDGKFEHSDFYAPETYVKVYNKDTKKYDEYAVQKGTMTVTIEDKILTAVASFICDNAVQYDLTFKTESAREHIIYDTEDGEMDYTFDSSAEVIVGDFVEDYGIIQLIIADNDYAVDFYFNADAMDEEIVVPAGVYPIDLSFNSGTVLACKGILPDGPAQSYFCGLDAEGYLDPLQLYCLVDGTVTVENVGGQLKLEVDAVNSYDVPVTLHYVGKVDTAVEDVTVDNTTATKRIINGQLFIIRNGETYNANGALVK